MNYKKMKILGLCLGAALMACSAQAYYRHGFWISPDVGAYFGSPYYEADYFYHEGYYTNVYRGVAVYPGPHRHHHDGRGHGKWGGSGGHLGGHHAGYPRDY